MAWTRILLAACAAIVLTLTGCSDKSMHEGRAATQQAGYWYIATYASSDAARANDRIDRLSAEVARIRDEMVEPLEMRVYSLEFSRAVCTGSSYDTIVVHVSNVPKCCPTCGRTR